MILKDSQQNKQYAEEDPTWWQSLFNNLGGILSGTANIIGASKGNPYAQQQPGTTYYYNPENQQKSNVGLYVILGVVGIAVVAGIVMLTKK